MHVKFGLKIPNRLGKMLGNFLGDMSLCYNTEVHCVLVVDFSIMVLSSGSWPFQQSSSFTLPTEVSVVWLFSIVDGVTSCL